MTEKNKKPISVLMAVFNEKEVFLKKAIESILSQTFSDFEFVIIDDGSTDEKCWSVLKEYEKKDGRIKLFQNEKNIGLTRSLNEGLEICEGKFVARIDSDDMAERTRLEKQYKFMNENPDHALCGSWASIINEKDEEIGRKKFSTSYEEIRKKILYFNFFTHSSLFFRRDLILEKGGYNEKIEKAQDYDLVLKISAEHPVANIAEFLCLLRDHPGSISSKGKKKQEWYAIIARMKAVFSYGYSWVNFFKIIPSFFYFLFIPYFLEKKIFNLYLNK